MTMPLREKTARRRAPRASYDEITLYAPERAPCRTDLSDNTNLWGMPPAAERALLETPTAAVTRYPSLYAAELKHALADYIGSSAEAIVTGCGSDDVLDSAIRAFAEPGERLAFIDPGFAMIPIFARMNGLEPVAVPLLPHLDVDADAMLATGARIIYLCSPNNPTGTAASAAAIQRIIERAPGIVILDEAYAEFGESSWAGSAPSRENLLVVRTMSKAFGMAGLRVGYALGAAPLVTAVEKSRGPYKVSAIAERCAIAALRDDGAWVRERIADARENRARLADALRALGLEPIPSAANFLLVPMPGAANVAQALRARGVAVRPFESLTGIGEAVRISVGPWSMLEELIGALEEVLACA